MKMSEHGLANVAGRLAMAAVLATGCVTVSAETAEKESPAVASSQTAISAGELDKLIEQLGDKDYYVRQQAQDELARLGFEAFDVLSDAATHEDLEIAARAKYLLRLMRVEWTVKGDPPQVKNLLRDYELQDPEGRQSRMHLLARLPDSLGVAALCRLVRFEKSLLLSKKAALELLQDWVSDGPPTPAAIETVQKLLRGSTRPSAAWLLTWTRMVSDPKVGMQEWSRLIDEEQAALQRAPSDSKPEIVVELLRTQIKRLKQLGRTDEAIDAVHRLVELERGSPKSLAELTDWLVEQKAWKALDELAERFAAKFDADPDLLYTIAQAYTEQGQKDRAEDAATRALRLYPGKQPEQLNSHLNAGQNLRQRGLFTWARREFEHIIAVGDSKDPGILAMRILLAEMLHDQGEDLEAAQVLERLVDILEKRKAQESESDVDDMAPKEIQSRMHYFFACHWEKKNDLGKRRERLDKALESYDEDVDVLIACYRLPAQPAEYHAKIGEAIKKTTASLREQIAEMPELDTTYNQLAWLIGNTEGDLDEALKCSQKSLELATDEHKAGYYDTLARVYFAKGQWADAVRYQTQALALEPHSGQMRRQLEFFQKTREEKDSNGKRTGP